MKAKFLSLAVFAVSTLSAAVVWENNLPASMAMYYHSGTAAAPVIEDSAITFATKKGMAIFVRKNVNFSADHGSLELQLKAPAGNRSINIYFTTDSDKKYAENKKISIFYKATGNWQTVKFECGKHKLWQGNITGLRIDFHTPGGEKIYFKSAVFKSKHDLPKAWNFGAADAKAWKWRSALSAPASIVNGAMKLELNGKYSMSPVMPLFVDAAKCPTMIVRLRVSKPGNYGFVLYFKTETENKLGEARKIPFRFNATGEYQEFRVPLNRYASWKGNITGFRLDISSPEVPSTMEITDITFENK